MRLDANTLFLVTIYVEAILGLLLLFAGIQNSDIRAIGWWGFAHLLLAMSLVMFGIQADPHKVARLAQDISAIPEINCVIVLLGRYSLLAMGLFQTVEQMHELVTERLRTLDGVRDVETSISVHNIKYEASIARITPQGEAA